jgi:hypothetical protein
MTTRFRLPLLFAAALLAAAPMGAVAAADVQAQLSPNEIQLGDQAQLRLTINGSAGRVQLPLVDGLFFRQIGYSSMMNWVNGSLSATTIIDFVVIPQRAGTFTIPPLDLGGAKSAPLTLKVGATTTITGSTAPPAGQQPLPSPQVASSPQGSTDEQRYSDQPAFIRLAIPRNDLYVGEYIPVQVKAYFRQGLQVRNLGLPAINSEALTIQPLGTEPQQSEAVLSGNAYTVLSWDSALTAVKAGDFPVTMKMPMQILVRQQLPTTNGGIFDESFMQQLMQGGRTKDVTLESEAQKVVIHELPETSRPADFSGAVGHFELTSSVEQSTLNLGDPATLKMAITGAGNFSRVTSAMIPSGKGFKTYSPKSTFAATDSIGYSGTKSFEQAVIPQNAGSQQLPAISFSFFDPEKKTYATLTSQPIMLTVEGTSSQAPVTSATASSTLAPPTAPAAAPDILPNQLDSGRFVSSLQPVVANPVFLAAQALPLLVLTAGLLLLRRKQRLENDPAALRNLHAGRAIREHLKRLDQAAAAGDTTAFFTAARDVLQERLGERWGLRPETLTMAEIKTRLGADSGNLATIFAQADAIDYSGQAHGATDLAAWKETVLQELKRLETNS